MLCCFTDPAFDCVEKCSFKVRFETESFQALMIYNLWVKEIVR